jgi:hypothetical protein
MNWDLLSTLQKEKNRRLLAENLPLLRMAQYG